MKKDNREYSQSEYIAINSSEPEHGHGHGHGHDHSHKHGHEHADGDTDIFTIIRLIIAAVIFVGILIPDKCGFLVPESLLIPLIVLYLVPFAIAGFETAVEAFQNVIHGELFGEEFLMFTAGIAAFAVGEYAEAVSVMLLFQLGEILEDRALGKSTRSIQALMDIAPEYANLEDADMQIKRIDPSKVRIGSVIVVKSGERVPIDSIVIRGASSLDVSALTGESVPVRVGTGEPVYSGSINQGGVLTCRTVKEYEDSMVARILELTKEAAEHKSKTENFITRFSKYYTPAVILAAFLLAVIPGIITGNWSEWVGRACTFLVISCPCALVISVPLGFFGGIGAASKMGVLVKGSNYLEAVSKLETVAFDKTGTLTKGEFTVNGTVPVKCERSELLRIAAAVELNSTHPIARSVCRAYASEPVFNAGSDFKATEVREISGKGMSAVIDGKNVLVGNDRLMEENNIAFDVVDEYGTIVYVASDGMYLGAIIVSDGIRPGMSETVSELHKLGVKKTVMVTGDVAETANRVASEIGIDEYISGLLPEGKVDVIQNILAEKHDSNRLVAYIGDGINDAPVLSRADVGIAMGSLGSASAIEAADIVIMDDNPGKLPELIRLSRKTMGIIKGNIAFALTVKGVVLILGAMGMAAMWLAVFADVGVSLLCILNSLRIQHGLDPAHQPVSQS